MEYTDFKSWKDAAKAAGLSDPQRVQGFEQYQCFGPDGVVYAGWSGAEDKGTVWGSVPVAAAPEPAPEPTPEPPPEPTPTEPPVEPLKDLT